MLAKKFKSVIKKIIIALIIICLQQWTIVGELISYAGGNTTDNNWDFRSNYDMLDITSNRNKYSQYLKYIDYSANRIAQNEKLPSDYSIIKNSDSNIGYSIYAPNMMDPSSLYEDVKTKKGFLLSNNNPGECYMKWTNALIYEGQKIDVKMTFIGWTYKKDNSSGVYSVDGTFGHFNSRSNTLRNLDYKLEFFVAGTNNKAKIKGVISLTGIDQRQSVGININDIDKAYIHTDTHLGAWLDSDNYLNLGNNDDYHTQHYGGNCGPTQSHMFSIILDTSKHEFVRLRIRQVNSSGSDKLNRNFNLGMNTKQYIAFDLNRNLNKTTNKTTLQTINETFTYNINYEVPNEQISNNFYKSLYFQDQVDSKLLIKQVKIYSQNDNTDKTNLFTISTANNNIIARAITKNNVVPEEIYGKIFRMEIIVQYNGQPITGVSSLTFRNTSHIHIDEGKGDNDITSNETVTTLPVGYLQITKRDVYTNETMKNIKFGIYTDVGCTNLVQNLITGEDGTAKSDGLSLGTYYVKELEVAPNYILNSTVQTVRVVSAGQIVNADFTNKPNTAIVEVTKLDNQTEKTVTKEDTTFAIYEWSVDSNKYIRPTHILENTFNGRTTDGAVILKQKVDGTKGIYSGTIYYNASNEGKFKIVEYSRPFGYTLSQWSKEVKITEDGQIFAYNNEIRNNQVRVQLNFKKNDIEVNYKNESYKENFAQGDSTIEGAVYGLYAREPILSPDDGSQLYAIGQEVARDTTDAEGKITWDNLYIGKYYIQEITASKGYLLDTTQYEVDIDNYYNTNYYLTGDQTSQNIIYKNTIDDNLYENTEERVLAKEKIKKQAFQLTKLSLNHDETMGNPLENAGFKVFLISELTKVKDGTIKPDINGNYNARDFLEYDFTNELTALNFANNPNGERIQELFTSDDGILKSPELAYGQYIVIESTVPEGYNKIFPFIVKIEEDSRQPKNMLYPIDREFRARIRVVKKDNTTEKVVLKENAAYRIWDLEKNEYVEQWTVNNSKIVQYGTENNPYKTTEDGELITPEQLLQGSYELREVKAPEGYVLSGREEPYAQENVKFSISTNEVYEIDERLGIEGAIITVEQENTPQLGTVTVLKQGEFLSNSKKQDHNYEFTYTKRPVTDAKFAIYAKEDILTQDNQVDEYGERTKIYRKDELVKEVKTNEEGKAIFENLPLGKYYIKETKAGEGFVLNTEEKEIEFTYQGQNIAIVYKDTEYLNERQKVEINVTKKDAEDGTALEGAVFGLYTKEEIKYIDNEGNIQKIDANELIAEATTKIDGIASFDDENIPLGKYYIKEIQAPVGYSSNAETIDVDCSYIGQENNKVILNLDFTNIIIKLKIKVKDYETSENLEDTKFKLKDEFGNILGEYTIDELGEVEIKGLVAGRQYLIEETKERYGYVKDLLFSNNLQDKNELQKGKDLDGLVTFTIKDSQEPQSVTLNNIAKVGELEIEKIGDVLVGTDLDNNGNIEFQYNKQRIDTATFELFAKEDIIHPDGVQGIILDAGTKVGEGQTKNGILTFTKFPHELIESKPEVVQLLLNRGLPLGTYEIKEIEAPEGYYYTQDEQIKTVVIEAYNNKEKVEKQTITLENPRQSTNIGKPNSSISVTKEADKEVYKVGEEAIYTILVSNTGNTVLKNVEVKESMINGKFDDQEGITKKDNNIIIIPELKVGETKTLIYRYIVEEGIKGKIDNKVVATATPVINSTTSDGKQTEQELDKVTDDEKENVYVETIIEKEANKKIFKPGSIIEYTLTILNPNDKKMENVIIKDDKVTIGSIIKSSKEGINITEDGIINVGEVAPREKIEIVYSYQIPKDFEGEIIENEAELTGTIEGQNMSPEKDTEIVEVKKSLIEVTKKAEKDTYRKGEEVKYNIVVKNTGETLLTDIIVKETLLGGKFQEKAGIEILDDQTVKIDQLKIGQSITLTYKYKITEDRMIAEKIYNNVVATGNGLIENPLDPYNPKKEEVSDESQSTIVIKEDILPTSELGVYKEDIETKEPIEGVIFGLYTAEDILGVDGTVLVDKDTLIEKATTDKNGYAKFKADLPIGKFYLLEISPLAGYIKNTQKIDIDSTKIQPNEKEYKVKIEVQNKKTEINIEKIEKTSDLINRIQIVGAKLQILDENQNVIKEWITDGKPYNIKGLETGKEYTLYEKEQGKGYVTTDDIKFSINTDGTLKIDKKYVLEKSSIPTIIMQDDITRVKVDIVDKQTKEPVKDVVVQIVDKNTGEVVEEFVTDGKEHIIEKLPIGDYEIVEKDFPRDKGYVPLVEKQTLTVKDTSELQEKIIEQDYTKLDVTLLDETTKDILPGAKLELRDKNGEVVATIEDTGIVWYKERLPSGEYTLVEVSTPEGYEKSEDIKFTLKDVPEVQHVVMENKRLPFDLKVEKYASEVLVNGVKQAGTDYNNLNKLIKVDLDGKKIGSQKVQVKYIIRVTNVGKVAGSVGKVVDSIPSGLAFNANKNPSYWKKENNGTVSTLELANKVLKPGENTQLQIVLDWNQNSFNFGNKVNIVSIGQFKNNPGFGDENSENNNGTSSVLFSIKTGLEIVLTKQTIATISVALLAIGILVFIEILIIRRKNKQ